MLKKIILGADSKRKQLNKLIDKDNLLNLIQLDKMLISANGVDKLMIRSLQLTLKEALEKRGVICKI